MFIKSLVAVLSYDNTVNANQVNLNFAIILEAYLSLSCAFIHYMQDKVLLMIQVNANQVTLLNCSQTNPIFIYLLGGQPNQ